MGYGLTGYKLIPFALITVATPAQATNPVCDVCLATPRSIRRRRVGKAHTCSLLSEPSFRRLLVLIFVFENSFVGRIYTVMNVFCQERFQVAKSLMDILIVDRAPYFMQSQTPYIISPPQFWQSHKIPLRVKIRYNHSRDAN